MTAELAEVVEEKHPGQISIYRSTDPSDQLAEARARAKALVDMVEEQGLARNFGGDRPHVSVEGWQFLASQFGLIPDIEWTKEIDAGWEARAQLVRLSDGVAIAHAEAECRRTETRGFWKDAEPYAIRSMAQTRAVSKVCRVALSSVMVLAGFAATPAEEMDGVTPDAPKSADDPHCVPCLYINGELVAVNQRDRKPYFTCANRENCAETREYKGKTYGWAGWHESFEASRDEWLDNHPEHAGAQEKIVGERADYTMWILDEIERTLVVDRDKAKALVRTGLVYAIEENRFDPEQALGEPLLSNDLDDEQLRRIITNLDASEAQVVVTAACELGGQE